MKYAGKETILVVIASETSIFCRNLVYKVQSTEL